MRTSKLQWIAGKGWALPDDRDADLVVYFGGRAAFGERDWFEQLRSAFPGAHLAGCSAGSQIFGRELREDGITALALKFEATRVDVACVPVGGPDASRQSGVRLGQLLHAPDLAGVLILSDGLQVNGSELIKGISAEIGPHIPISGGLAADGPDFEETLVGLNARPQSGQIAAIGLYGTRVRLFTGSAGGWAEFGPLRQITKSTGSTLHMLDDEPALDLYERYLGAEEAAELPGSALLYPLKISDPDDPSHGVVRTVLSVDRNARTMTFAGDMPEGWVAQLMRGNIDRLADGAAAAARQTLSIAERFGDDALVLMVSCIGRRLLMGQRTVDEIDAVHEVLGDASAYFGFYSYGEICPHDQSGRGEMHNQTMTITVIDEAA